MGAARLALLAALAAGCSDLSIPEDAVIPCAADDECPDRFVCQGDPGTCVDAALADRTPPALDGAPSLEPRIGNLNTDFILTFDVTEPLKAPPIVTALSALAGEVPFTLDEEKSEGTHYTFTFHQLVLMEEGRAIPIRIDMSDQANNVTRTAAPDPLQLDNTRPSISGQMTAVPTGALGPGTVVHVTFLVTEKLAAGALPVVDVFREDAYDPAAGRIPPVEHPLALYLGEDGEEKFTYELVVPDVAGDPGDENSIRSGAYLTRVSLIDEAGNADDSLIGARLVLDFDAPSILTEPAAVAPRLDVVPDDDANPLTPVTALRAGGTAVVTFRSDEDAAVDPVVFAACGDRDLYFARLAGETAAASFTYLLDAASVSTPVEGSCALSADVVDAAGNRATRSLALDFAVELP